MTAVVDRSNSCLPRINVSHQWHSIFRLIHRAAFSPLLFFGTAAVQVAHGIQYPFCQTQLTKAPFSRSTSPFPDCHSMEAHSVLGYTRFWARLNAAPRPCISLRMVTGGSSPNSARDSSLELANQDLSDAKFTMKYAANRQEVCGMSVRMHVTML